LDLLGAVLTNAVHHALLADWMALDSLLSALAPHLWQGRCLPG